MQTSISVWPERNSPDGKRDPDRPGAFSAGNPGCGYDGLSCCRWKGCQNIQAKLLSPGDVSWRVMGTVRRGNGRIVHCAPVALFPRTPRACNSTVRCRNPDAA